MENLDKEETKCACGANVSCECEPNKETLEEGAKKWVFETNGYKWSNNDNTAGDNYGSFIAGAKWQAEKNK